MSGDVGDSDIEGQLDLLAAVATHGWSVVQRTQLATAALCHSVNQSERLDAAERVSKLYRSKHDHVCHARPAFIVTSFIRIRGRVGTLVGARACSGKMSNNPAYLIRPK
jgi:hypothetical protein